MSSFKIKENIHRKTGRSDHIVLAKMTENGSPVIYNSPFQGGTSFVVPQCNNGKLSLYVYGI